MSLRPERIRKSIVWLLICICVGLMILTACSSKPTDMRTLVPADSLVYLETNDLAAAIRPIIDSEAFAKAAKTKPDLSVLQGIQVAVTVSGFEMSEEKLTEEHSVARVQPRFVAIADTHAWNWQAVAFAENSIGSFVMDIYRSDVSQDKTEKHGGTYFTWTAVDGRKAFALAIGSIVYFGNDETAIERCLTVRSGQVDSIVKTGKATPAASGHIASGYISADGVAQIANIAGLTIANQLGEGSDVQSAIAGILPQLLRGIVSEVSWTAASNGGRVEDRFTIRTPDDVAKVFSETLAPTGNVDQSFFGLIPADMPSITAYDLAKPNVAWRSLLLTSQTVTDPLSGKVIGAFSGALAEPYGIREPEMFLSGAGPSIVTGNADPAGEKPFLIASVVVPKSVREALDPFLKPDQALSTQYGTEVLRSEDGEVAAAFVDGKIVTGHPEAVEKCLRESGSDRTIARSPSLLQGFASGASATTRAVDRETAIGVAAALSGTDIVDQAAVSSTYTTETRFNRNGIERRTISDFGLIGWIIAHLSS